MAESHPISDMFTRIRNALMVRHDEVVFPYSSVKLAISKILKEDGFIKFYEVQNESGLKKTIKISLKYAPSGESVISELKVVSKPGKRVYLKKYNIPKILNGFGISLISTSKGILSGKAARIANVGGEFLATVA